MTRLLSVTVSFRAVLLRHLRSITANVFFMKGVNTKIIKNIQKNNVRKVLNSNLKLYTVFMSKI